MPEVTMWMLVRKGPYDDAPEAVIPLAVAMSREALEGRLDEIAAAELTRIVAEYGDDDEEDLSTLMWAKQLFDIAPIVALPGKLNASPLCLRCIGGLSEGIDTHRGTDCLGCGASS